MNFVIRCTLLCAFSVSVHKDKLVCLVVFNANNLYLYRKKEEIWSQVIIIISSLIKMGISFSMASPSGFSRFGKEPCQTDGHHLPSGWLPGKVRSFFGKESAEGFVVEDDVQEMDIIREEFDRKRNSGQYTLMVLPTYDCNLRCWYCIQEHQNMTLSDETVARIKKHIEKYLLENEIKEISPVLVWGRTPLGLPKTHRKSRGFLRFLRMPSYRIF